MSADAKIQVNFKTGPGHDAALINVYANDGHELDTLLASLTERIPTILATKQQLQAGGVVEAGLPLAPTQPAQPPAGPPPLAGPPAGPVTTAPPAGGIEVEVDRYNNKFFYGDPTAPALPDGRGNYIRKEWLSVKGQFLKAWVDPAKGPRPATPGATEADIIWIK